MRKLCGPLAIVSILIVGQGALAYVYPKGGKIFDRKEGFESAPLFQMTIINESGDDIKKTYYKDREGKIAVSEITTLKDGNFKRLDLDSPQDSSHGSIERRDGKLFFSYQVKGQSVKSSSEDDVENFVVPSTMVLYLQRQWGKLMAGEKVKVRFGVVDRAESVGFEYSKTKDFTEKKQNLVVIKMKASSLFVSAIVDPIYFTVDKDQVRVVRSDGRVIPKLLQGKKLMELDALTLFEY
jgi:hypothetical protein